MPEDYHRTEASQPASDPRTQADRILRLLQEAWPSWVSARDMALTVSLQYCARIFELRQRGILITNKVVRLPDGRKQGFFRIDPPPIARRSELPAETEPPSLFGNLKMRHRDDG